MSLLKYDITKKGQVDETTTRLEFETSDNGKEHEFEAIWDNALYARESEGYLLGLYYLVSWKSYSEEENI